MKRIWLALLIPTLVAISCKNEDELDKLKEQEVVKLNQYIAKNHPDAQPTTSGMYIISEQEGSGEKPAENDVLVIKFKAILIDGKIVETSSKALAEEEHINSISTVDEPYKFSFINMLPGLKEGLLSMKKGGVAKLIIPSWLAYDKFYSSLIPSYSTLIYYIELLDVQKRPDTVASFESDQFVTSTLQMQVIDSSGFGFYTKKVVTGTGSIVQQNDVIHGYYECKLPDGRIVAQDTIDNWKIGSTIQDYPFMIFSAWNKMLASNEVRVGDEYELFVPWNKAHGKNAIYNLISGRQVIPPYSNLYYNKISIIKKITKN